jgi:hypothetical protein
MEDKIFDIAFESSGRQYKGSVNPSDKMNDDGQPSSFHVVLQDTSFGYLSLQNCKWTVNEQRPAELIEAIGKEIEKRYKL